MLVLRFLLKRIGLKIEEKRIGKTKKTEGYQLEAESYIQMMTYAKSYVERKGISVNLDKPLFKHDE